MVEMEQIAFQLISEVGSARSHLMEALQAARRSEYELAQNHVESAEQQLMNGHKIHAQLIQKEASGEGVPVTLLLLHAEDLMLTTETMRELVKEMLYMYEEFRR